MLLIQKKASFFFVCGYGGTGKTFLWNTIINHLRSQQKIVLSVASSGVASLLLPGGRTAHSRFKIPCDLDETTICNIKRGTMLANLIKQTSLIIWDEALMTHKAAFEALDRTLRDLLSLHSPDTKELPFGGKVVVLGGDPRQILPVIEGGSRSEIVAAAICNSKLWSHVTVLTLTQNMRLLSPILTEQDKLELAEFNQWMLNIGEGNIPATAKEGDNEPFWIKIPKEFLIMPPKNAITSLIETIYPNLATRFKDTYYLSERAVLTPTNEVVDNVNDVVVSMVPGHEKEYLSCDRIARTPNMHDSYEILYPVEFLNSLNGNNFPHHKIILKEGVPIMLLRNLNQSEGLCNGTRLVISRLGQMIIEAKIITGNHKGKIVLIPRIALTLKTTKWPFILERRQYPIKIC